MCLDSVASKVPKESSGAKLKKPSESEFISDKFKSTNERDLVEIQENMTRLGMTASTEAQAEAKKSSAPGKTTT